MKFAIAGLGFISPRHIQGIKETGGEVVLTCDIDPTKNPTYTSFREMLGSTYFRNNVDAVAICTPNYWHASMIDACLYAGKKVLCEKPLVLDENNIPRDETVATVLQLRHHPEVIKLKNEGVKGNGNITVKVFRDKDYWASWKGDEAKSGGIVFNIGIHYLDLLIHLFGDEYRVEEALYSPKIATGRVVFGREVITYHFEIMDSPEGQNRVLEISGKEVSLSKQDNLSFEGLHTKVYEDFVRGIVVPPSEALKSIKLAKICTNAKDV